jgi:protein TonB
MATGIDSRKATLQRAGAAFGFSLLLHASLLAAALWLFGSVRGEHADARSLQVTLAPAPSAVTSTQAVVAAAAATARPALHPAAGAASPTRAPRQAVITVDAPAETEAERRLREALAAMAAEDIVPPAHSLESADAGDASVMAAAADAMTPSASAVAGADAARHGFVELHVLDWLAQHRHYPRAARRAGIEGTVHVRFVIDPLGRIGEASIERSSGARSLDRAALDLLGSASPVPGLAQFGLREPLLLRLPIDYRLLRPRAAG